MLDDAVIEAAFSTDPYIRQHRARSILCLPLMNQAKLVGALYLENNLAAGVFSPDRIAVLKLVASQAAISLENARLYREVAERERRYREVQTELSHANRVATMGQLVASIAHEVNQPIAAAILNANAAQRWLNTQPPELDEVRHVLSRLILDANRAADVLGRIRQHIRKAPRQKGPVDINAAIGEMIEFSRSQIMKNGVALQTQLMDGLPLIEGDRVELQQVLLNLIMNALEAMSGTAQGERQLQISVAPGEAGYLRVSVSDSGPGFLVENTDQVFTSFYTTKPTGLGLGLSICRSIIEAHGGRLWASANQPCGATVQFMLPVMQDEHSRSVPDVILRFKRGRSRWRIWKVSPMAGRLISALQLCFVAWRQRGPRCRHSGSPGAFQANLDAVLHFFFRQFFKSAVHERTVL